MAGAKDISTPLSTTQSLHLLDGTTSVDNTEYRRIIGSLQYLSLTRPDICFAVNKLSQFMHKLNIAHLLMALQKHYGFLHFFMNSDFLLQCHLLYCVIILAQLTLVSIRFTTQE
jgi:hypothetical protein